MTIIAGALALPAGQAAFGQSPDLEEIVVTARKREESLLEVPLTISAFSADDIEQAGFSTITDLIAAVPGVTYESYEAEGRGDSASFRGVGSNTGDPTLQNSSKFIDGVYVSGSLFTALLGDLERVEVVKGPQSALFGRATFSGGINYITKKPTNEFEGSVRASVAEQSEYEFSASVAGPIIEDTLLFRATAGSFSQGSPYNNITNGAEMGEQDIQSFSGMLRYTPSSQLTADLYLMYSEAEFGEAARATTSLNLAPGSTRDLSFPLTSVIGGNTDQLGAPGIDSETFRANLNVNYQFDNGYDLTFIAGHSVEDTVNESDGDYQPIRQFAALFFLCDANSPFVGPDCDLLQTVTARELQSSFQEIRLTSPDDASLRWLLGVSYFDEDFDSSRIRNFRRPTTFKTSTNLSLFGSVSHDFSEKLTVGLDARYQQEEIQLNVPEVGSLQKDDFNAFLPRVIVEYNLTEDTLLYFSAAQGNKPGTFNAPSVPAQFLTVEEEKLWQYELGTKLIALDGKVNLQAAVFTIDWEDQVFRFNDPDPVIGSYFINSGQTDILGLDVAIGANFTDRLSGSFSYSWVDAEFQRFDSQNATPIFGDPSVAGNKTPRTAENAAFASLTYEAPLNAFGNTTEWFATADVSYRGEMFIDELNLDTIEPRTLVNIRAGIDTGSVRVTAFVNNATDNDALTTGFRFPPNSLVGLPMPRQAGVSINVNF
jgi:outer membrane receptor protein involved in Fe transport